jgi:hypothetical protein
VITRGRRELLIVILSVLAPGCVEHPVPIVMSEGAVRKVFLNYYPVGMPIEDFKKAMAARQMKILQEWNRPPEAMDPAERPSLMGERVLWVDLGMYQGVPSLVYVSAYVGFADGKLVDCAIRKGHQAP